MSASLLLAPTLQVATEHGCEQVRALRRDNSFAPVYVLLPRSETIDYWERHLGDCMGVHLVQFRSLAEDVLREGHRSARRAHTDEQLQIIREVLHDLAGEGNLTTFAPVVTRPGLAMAILDWLREVESQGITPARVSLQARRTGSERDAQLAAIYRRYAASLARDHSADTEGLTRRAARLLARDDRRFAQVRLLLVTGFDQFSPVQLDLLAQLARRVPTCCVYLLWDELQEVDGLALSRLRQTRDSLEKALAPLVQVLPEHGRSVSTITHVRGALFRVGPAPAPTEDDAVRAVEAPSREDEVRWALREAKRLLLAGARPDGVAILATQRDAYASTLAAVAHEYGVPARTEMSLAESPPVASVVALLALSPEFPRRETINALRDPYVEQPWLTPEQVATLDRLTRERPVVAGREQWVQALRNASGAGDEGDDERAPASLLAELPPEEVASTRDGLLAFLDHLTPPASGTRAELTRWVQERLLGLFADADEVAEPGTNPPSLNVAGRCEAGPWRDRDVDALARLSGILRRLALHHRAGAEAVTWDEYRAEVSARLATASVPDNPGLQTLYFDRLELARHVPFEHLFVLGLSEGEFPGLPAADVFYGDEERRRYPLPLVQRDAADDACLWWQVLAAARSSIALLRPRFDDAGAPWPASPYWDAVIATVPGLSRRVARLPLAEVPSQQSAASERELAVALASAGADRVPPGLSGALSGAAAAHEVWRIRRGWRPLGAHEGVLADAGLIRALEARFGGRHPWSPSRLSRYASCPYRFFAENVLRLEPLQEPEAGLDARVRGSVLHAILEGTYRLAAEAGIAPAIGTQPEMLRFLESACDRVLAGAPERFGFRPTTLWQHEQRELRRLLGALVRSECEANGHRPRFRPYLQEVGFGSRRTASPDVMLVDAAGAVLHLAGIIDRIDADESGALRIIDYKSGGTPNSRASIKEGRALQSVLYPLAAEQILPGARVADSYYLHLTTRETSGRVVFEGDGDGTNLANEVVSLLARLADGVRRGRFPIAADARSCERCDFSALCRADRIARARSRRSAQA